MDESTSDAVTSVARPQHTDIPHTESNQQDSHFVIAKCRRNAEVTDSTTINPQNETCEDSDTEEKLLVVVYRAGTLGAAYYTIQTGELFILDEIVDRPPEYQMFLSLLRQVEPVCLLLDGKTQATFVQRVKQAVFGGTDSRCKLVFISAREYSFEACKRRVLSLSLPTEPSPCSDTERTMYIRTVLDISKVHTVHALGALLRYLDLNWNSISLNMQSKPHFLSLRTISLYVRVLNKLAQSSTVAFEDVPLGSGGFAVPLSRTSSRQCVACQHKARLPDVPEPASAPPVLPDPVVRAPPEPARRAALQPIMSAKPETVREALEDRDPNNLNQHIQVVWDDIIGEPEGARSPECSWRLAHGCFRHARNWCYTLLTVLIAPPCALLLGCGFACLAFEEIWCTAPCLRCVKIHFASMRTFVAACMSAIVVPAAEAVGHMCRHIRINLRHDAPEERDLLTV